MNLSHDKATTEEEHGNWETALFFLPRGLLMPVPSDRKLCEAVKEGLRGKKRFAGR